MWGGGERVGVSVSTSFMTSVNSYLASGLDPLGRSPRKALVGVPYHLLLLALFAM